MQILTDCDNGKMFDAAPHLNKKKIVHVQHGICVGRLRNGTQNGQSTVCFFVPLPDGTTVVAELTMNNFDGVAGAMKGAEERDRILKQAGG